MEKKSVKLPGPYYYILLSMKKMNLDVIFIIMK